MGDIVSSAFDTGALVIRPVTRCLWSELTLVGSVVFPQARERLGGSQLADVGRHQSDNQQAVTAQVVLDELSHRRLGVVWCCQRTATFTAAAAAWRCLEVAKPPPHELYLCRPVHEAGRRQDEVDGCDRSHKYQPEPDDDEDLLVEQVDRQRTLHYVVVNPRLMMNLMKLNSHATFDTEQISR